MSAIPVDPTCDICGTTKQHTPGIGLYCPNHKCGEEPPPPVDDTPPASGSYVKLSSQSVRVVLGEKLREQPMLEKVQVKDLFCVLMDGTQRRVSHLMVQITRPKADKRPGPERMTSPSEKHPKGVKLRLATREGVTL